MNRLENETVALTGGASGLGRAIVERFIDEGANLVVLDRSTEGCDELKSTFGDRIATLQGDARSPEDNAALVALALDTFGKLDCAIGNAGIWDYNARLAEMDAQKLPQTFRELFDINVLGYIALAKAALKPLAASGGSIIYTVSQAGFMANGGGVLYTATKHAVVGVVKQLAYEFAPHVRVNGVAPGPIPTQLRGPEALNMQDRVFPAESIAARADQLVPLGRMLDASEYAGAYVFFASREDNGPATGTVLNHDGGFGARGIGPTPRGGDNLLDFL